MSLRFDVYGRFELELERRGGRWVAYRLGAGTRREDDTVFVPGGVPAEAVGDHLRDVLHELARPGHTLRRIR